MRPGSRPTRRAATTTAAATITTPTRLDAHRQGSRRARGARRRGNCARASPRRFPRVSQQRGEVGEIFPVCKRRDPDPNLAVAHVRRCPFGKVRIGEVGTALRAVRSAFDDGWPKTMGGIRSPLAEPDGCGEPSLPLPPVFHVEALATFLFTTRRARRRCVGETFEMGASLAEQPISAAG
jgi:hypothetical protein